ncbi:MAG: hypothetical protein RR802_02285 [Erysipelotrichaceae bacterium]
MKRNRIIICITLVLILVGGSIYRDIIFNYLTMDFDKFSIISSKENFGKYLSEVYKIEVNVLNMITINNRISSIEIQYIGEMNNGEKFIGQEYISKRSSYNYVTGNNKQVTPKTIEHARYLTSQYITEVSSIFEGHLISFYAYPIDTWEDLDSFFPNTKFCEKMKFYLIIDGDISDEDFKKRLHNFEEYIEFNNVNNITGYRMIDYELVSTSECSNISELFWTSYDIDDYFNKNGEEELTSKDLLEY